MHRSSTRSATCGNSSLTQHAALAVLLELPRRLEQVAGRGELHPRLGERQRLAVVAIELCQAVRSIEPLRGAMEEIHYLVDAAVGSR